MAVRNQARERLLEEEGQNVLPVPSITLRERAEHRE
jgi:hypothetical protein